MSDNPRSSLALAAAGQASIALAELIQFATEGDLGAHTPFLEEVVELLLDAAKIAIAIEAVTSEPDDERAEIKHALDRYLEGWR